MFIPITHAGVIEEATPISVVMVNALTMLLTISGTICIIALVISGILYLSAAHSGDQRLVGVAKKSFIFCMIGGIMILGSLIILQTLAGFLAV